MKKSLLIIIILFSFSSFAQKAPIHYRWHQYGIEAITEETMSVVEEDLFQLRCDGAESNLWITKVKDFIRNEQRVEYLNSLISSYGYQSVGKVKEELKDSILIYSARVANNKNYGYIFLFADTLANNNLFTGFMTTGSKPKSDILKLIEFKTFKANLNYSPTAGKSTTKGTVSEIDSDHNIIRESSVTDTLIIGKENINKRITEIYQKYSVGVTTMLKTYYALPEKLGARKIGEHIDFVRYFGDTVNVKKLFNNSNFVHEMFHNLDGWLSIQQSIKKTRGNYTDKVYSYYFSDTCMVDMDRLTVPAANIIHKSFPPANRDNRLYSLYIYPSSLNIHTQLYGVYALLEEFGAYNFVTEWYNDILPFYYDLQMANASFFAYYLANSTDNFLSSLYFKHYIVHYLFVLQSAAPEQYAKLMGDANFKKVYSKQCKKLNNQIAIFNTNKNRIREELANEYIPFIENEKIIKVNEDTYKNIDLANAIKLNDLLNTQPDYQRIFSEIGCEPGIPIILIQE